MTLKLKMAHPSDQQRWIMPNSSPFDPGTFRPEGMEPFDPLPDVWAHFQKYTDEAHALVAMLLMYDEGETEFLRSMVDWFVRCYVAQRYDDKQIMDHFFHEAMARWDDVAAHRAVFTDHAGQ